MNSIDSSGVSTQGRERTLVINLSLFFNVLPLPFSA